MSGIEQTRKTVRRTIRQDITGSRTSILQDVFLVRREGAGPVKPSGAICMKEGSCLRYPTSRFLRSNGRAAADASPG